MKLNLGFLTPFMETIQELADSKKAMIFMIAVMCIAQADTIGFPGVSPKLRLAAAVGLVGLWIVCQTVIDIFQLKKQEVLKITSNDNKIEIVDLVKKQDSAS